MNGKQGWAGIAPSPQVFKQLDQEEVSVLALLAWASATNRPVTSQDLAALPDRNGTALGIVEAKHITKTLAELKIASVLGMNNDRPLSVFLGGFQPASAAKRPGPGVQRPYYAKAEPDQLIENKAGGLPALRTTRMTPAFVPDESKTLREAQARVEAGEFGDDLVSAAVERKRILEQRIALYERWVALERNHPVLSKFLERKRKALPELRFQLERAQVKQAEAEAEQASAGE